MDNQSPSAGAVRSAVSPCRRAAIVSIANFTVICLIPRSLATYGDGRAIERQVAMNIDITKSIQSAAYPRNVHHGDLAREPDRQPQPDPLDCN
jgi:hypothetical protein